MNTEDLLKKIDIYADKKRSGGTLSLILESDESGFLIPSVFDCNEKKPVFEFNSLNELYEELKIK